MKSFKDIRISNIMHHAQFSSGAKQFGVEYLGLGEFQTITIYFGKNSLNIEWPQKPPKPTINVHPKLNVRHFNFLNKQYLIYFRRLLQKPQYCFSVLYIWNHEERITFINFGDHTIHIFWRVVLPKRWFKKERREFIKGLKKKMGDETQEYRESLRDHDEFMAKSYLERKRIINDAIKEMAEREWRESQEAENSENG